LQSFISVHNRFEEGRRTTNVIRLLPFKVVEVVKQIVEVAKEVVLKVKEVIKHSNTDNKPSKTILSVLINVIIEIHLFVLS